MRSQSRPSPGELPQNFRCTATEAMLVCAQSPHRPPFPLIADLRYDSGDPYAVCLTLHPGQGRDVRWLFARSLLADGSMRAVGDGDVAARPALVHGAAFVHLTLRSAASSISLLLPLEAVRSFLGKTDAMVLPGTEHLHLDVDALIHRLTERP